MVVTRSMSGATKKPDSKVAVNHKVAERASKKTTAERQRASKKTTCKRAGKKLTAAERLNWDAFEIFVCETYYPQYYEKHPDVKVSIAKNIEVSKYGYAEWMSMADSVKAPYVTKVKTMEDELIARAEYFIKVWVRLTGRSFVILYVFLVQARWPAQLGFVQV